jgi:exodeoxyribonuclease VII small subunit
MTNDPDPQTPPNPQTFEQALARLEQIVGQLEDGRTDLADSLARYEEGVRLLRQCHTLLERAERRIEVLSGVDADGNPVTEAFDDRSTLSLADEGAARSKRRTAKKPRAASPDAAAGDESPARDVDESGSLF